MCGGGIYACVKKKTISYIAIPYFLNCYIIRNCLLWFNSTYVSFKLSHKCLFVVFERSVSHDDISRLQLEHLCGLTFDEESVAWTGISPLNIYDYIYNDI